MSQTGSVQPIVPTDEAMQMDLVRSTAPPSTSAPGHLFTRLLGFMYGLVAYALFFITFLYAIGFVTNLVVPKTIDASTLAAGAATSTPAALLINLLLLSVFALQHSVMARKSFKQWWTRFVPASIERSTYVLFSSFALALLCWQWVPMPTVLWAIEDAALATLVTGICFAGWLMVLTSTFLINHFELFGLRQVASHLTGSSIPAPRFRTPLYYRFVRHPIYLGFMIAFWAAPTMTVGHLLFAAVTTAYIIVGTLLEERDLIATFGDEYRRYRARVAMLVPMFKRSSTRN